MYGYHIVAFVDLLGQRDQLFMLQSQGLSTDSRDMIREGLRASAGKVKLIRDTLTKWFDLLMKQPPPGNMPTGVRNHVWKLRSFPYGIMGFADSVVISVPLEDDAVMTANRPIHSPE